MDSKTRGLSPKGDGSVPRVSKCKVLFTWTHGVEVGRTLGARLRKGMRDQSERAVGSGFHQLTASSRSAANYVYLCCVPLNFPVSSLVFLLLLVPSLYTSLLSTLHSFYDQLAKKFIMDAFTPAQTTELVSRIGAKKARMRIDKMFINSFMGGALISFGCALALSTNSSPWFQTNAPGLIRTISAMVFPVGLISKSSSIESFSFSWFASRYPIQI